MCAISMVPFMFIYVKAHIQHKLKSANSFFYIGAVLLIIIFSFMVVMMLKSMQNCHDTNLKTIYRHIATQLYFFQGLILIGLWFYRLQYIFHGTFLQLSSCTIIIFCSVYLLFTIIAVSVAVLWVFDILPSMATVVAALAISLTIYLTGMFVYKLRKLIDYNKNPKLMKTMMKISLLVFISTTFTLFTAIFNILFGMFTTIHMGYIFDLIIISDVYTSYLCVFLAFRYFENYYEWLCGCMERLCFRTFCRKYQGNVDDKCVKREIESNVAQPSETIP